ncbi:Sphingolipid C9-methyltransferase 1 [Fusarium irregulare]|uniref:sphingolipid C(9)-methyltransferase n=1 Tax=Fusarium irregulare TaxID=2494466 RepID=A0A9W8U8U5_9HYPO|nr:Sphingolipid C9-methyltransferase 1 [Fusarium irregulare]KAJ4014731.1 Sphingolipid C9-methyltransferase 1 [Fusarium irregulare]
MGSEHNSIVDEIGPDFPFKATPKAAPPTLKIDHDCGVKITTSPAINNPPLPADGPGNETFSNGLLISLLVLVPTCTAWRFGGGFKTTVFFALITTLPILIAFWTIASSTAPRANERVKCPGLPVEHYLTFHKEEDRAKYRGRNKVPIETFMRKYFDGDADFNGDVLEVLEWRHDWASFRFTWELFRFIIVNFATDVLVHSRSQDEDQVREHYDRGDDFYAWFLGPRMVYTSGIISDVTKEESLEQLQDNKLAIVCEKIALKPGETLLDIGCGWGTLAKFASVNYGAKVTGITLGRNQTKWGNETLRRAGVTDSQIHCMDYRDMPKAKYDKITCLEMAEHVGIFKITNFLRQCRDMLEDDGVMHLQIAGIRQAWQYEDLVWGLFMNKYVFPGADASTPLAYYIGFCERAGWEVKSVDTIGVHYSATIWRWYRNWLANEADVTAKYGVRWFKIWKYFLASATISSRQGSATCYQITLVKNINSVHRIDGVSTQFALSTALEASKKAGRAVFPADN